MFNGEQRRLLVLSGLGGVLEFYDFIIYALLASYIAKDFFPAPDSATSLLETFATFSVGYLVRPLGGMIFGHYGDKLGRKKTFMISILMMALATFLIAFVPPYSAIGVAAPIIVTLLRVIQGLSVGGEIPGAIAYVSESIPEKKGLACGVVFFCLINGIVLGSLVQAIISSIISAEQMLAWGWRIPFIIGGLFGFASYILRRDLEESPLFRKIEDKIESFPLGKVFKLEFVNAFAGIFITALGASIISALFLFTPAYFNKVLNLPAGSHIWMNTAFMFLAAILAILFGFTADKLKTKPLILILIFATLIFAGPIFFIYHKHLEFYALAFGLSALLTGFAWGVIPGFLSELFPTSIRYTGVALSYNFGFAIFGGLTPLISMFLIYKTGSPVAPAAYLIFVALLAAFAWLFIKTKHL